MIDSYIQSVNESGERHRDRQADNYIDRVMDRFIEGERQRNILINRYMDGQRKRQIDRQIAIQRDREGDRQIAIQRGRESDRQTDRQLYSVVERVTYFIDRYLYRGEERAIDRQIDSYIAWQRE